MKEYIVIEIQSYDSGDVGTLVSAYEDYWDAEQKYHTVLAAAAKSALPIHTAVIMNPSGVVIEKVCFNRKLRGGE